VGLVESYNETLEFFSASGVPLRSVVSLSLKENRFKVTNSLGRTPGQAQPLPPGSQIGPALSAAGIDPTNWRGAALANALETPRFSVSGSIDVSAVHPPTSAPGSPVHSRPVPVPMRARASAPAPAPASGVADAHPDRGITGRSGAATLASRTLCAKRAGAHHGAGRSHAGARHHRRPSLPHRGGLSRGRECSLRFLEARYHPERFTERRHGESPTRRFCPRAGSRHDLRGNPPDQLGRQAG